MNSKQKSVYYGRFKGAPWFDRISQSTIWIGGQGGVGSHLTFFLARTGADLITVDYDVVEDHNIAGQLYGKEEVGLPKVEAMHKIVSKLCGECNVSPMNSKIELGKDESALLVIPQCDVVCVSFDNIAIRRTVFEYWLEHGKEDSLFVDGRMSMEQGNVFALPWLNTPEEVKHYRDSCFDDAELKEPSCTTKATTHCGSFIASLMVAQITNWFTNKDENALSRSLPIQINFNLPLMLFEQVNLETCTTETTSTPQENNYITQEE